MKLTYGEEERLLPNQEYHLSLSIKGETLQDVQFTSRYTPLYSTVKIIRSDFRTLFADYTDHEIYQSIHMNSLLANELAGEDLSADTPFYAKQYVRYKTEMDIITEVMVKVTSQSGSQEKSLGEFRIATDFKAPKLDGILKLLQTRLMAWEIQLTGATVDAGSSVRAGASEYPLRGRVF